MVHQLCSLKVYIKKEMNLAKVSNQDTESKKISLAIPKKETARMFPLVLNIF